MSDPNLIDFATESTQSTTPSSELDYFTTTVTSNASEPSSTLPIDMVFNDGHRVVIIVNRWVRTKSFSECIEFQFKFSFLVILLLCSILIVVSSIGNFTVLILLIRRRLKNPSRIDAMLMHLSLADLIVTFLNMPLEIGTNWNLVMSLSRTLTSHFILGWAVTVSWAAGDPMCRLMSFFRTFGLYLSSNVLVCISIDR